jgi:hypothetical protein
VVVAGIDQLVLEDFLALTAGVIGLVFVAILVLLIMVLR